MSIGLNKNYNSNIYYTNSLNRANSNAKISFSTNNIKINKEDKANNGKFDFSQAAKNLGKGVASPITNLLSSPKNLLIGAGMTIASMAVIAATGGAAAPLFVVAGLGMGALQAGKAISSIITAKNGDDIEKAFYDVGGATTSLTLSAIGAKTSLKQANIETKGLSIINSIKKCFTSSKDLSIECFKVFKSGYFKTNLATAIKIMKQPKSIRKFAKESFNDGEKHFEYSYNSIKDTLPEELKPYFKGRNKCEISRFEKIARKRTVDVEKSIKEINKNPDFSPRVKKEMIKDVLEHKKRIAVDSEYARSMINDEYGVRLSVEKDKIDKIVSWLSDGSKQGKFEILELSNYGNNNKYYFSDSQIDILRKVAGNLEVEKASKSSGYKAVHLKLKPKNGKIIELQIRGKEIDITADWEHIPYDLRQNKDIAKGNNYIGMVTEKVKKAIKGLTDEQYKKYQQYIKDNYAYAEALEDGILIPEPKLPQGINPILGADKLEFLYLGLSHLTPGKIKSPFEIRPQLGLISGTQSMLES